MFKFFNKSKELAKVKERYELTHASKLEHRSKKAKKTGFLKLMLFYSTQYKFLWGLLIFFTIFIAGTTVAIPKLINIIFSDITINTLNHKMALSTQVLIYWAIGFAGIFLLMAINRFFQRLFGGRIAQKIQINIRSRILNKLFDLDLNYYHDKKMGDILTKLISDTQIIGQQTYQIPIQFLNGCFTFIGSLVILFTLQNKVVINGQTFSYAAVEAQLAGIVMGCVLFLLFLALSTFSILRKKRYIQRRVVSAINGDINDRINAIRLIKTSATTAYEKKRISSIHEDYFKVSMSTVRTEALIFALFITVFSSLNVIALLVSIVFVNQHKLAPSIMIAFTLSINSLIFPIVQFISLFGNLATASSSAWRINEILNEKSTIKQDKTNIALQEPIKTISFKNVMFYYEDSNEKILENFSYTFKKGESYALVSESGVGKTTISQLLLRLYDPIQGEIVINGQYPLNQIYLKSYLNRVGYVEQEPQILFGNFYDNIAYGSFNATTEKIEAAATKANLDQFIQTLPHKYKTLVGERGFILSGGQKQRLVIARMFLRNPEFLILDEATSSLDNVVEQEIQKEINILAKNRMTIIIAHRLSTIKNVDHILVLEKGKGIVQSGTFQELAQTPGRFKHLYEAGLMN